MRIGIQQADGNKPATQIGWNDTAAYKWYGFRIFQTAL